VHCTYAEIHQIGQKFCQSQIWQFCHNWLDGGPAGAGAEICHHIGSIYLYIGLSLFITSATSYGWLI